MRPDLNSFLNIFKDLFFIQISCKIFIHFCQLYSFIRNFVLNTGWTTDRRNFEVGVISGIHWPINLRFSYDKVCLFRFFTYLTCHDCTSITMGNIGLKLGHFIFNTFLFFRRETCFNTFLEDQIVPQFCDIFPWD